MPGFFLQRKPDPMKTTRAFSFRSTGGILTYLWAVAASLILSACVSPIPVVPTSETPKAGVGYVAGVFSAAKNNYGLGITSVDGGEEIVLPFVDPALSTTGSVVPDRFTMVQLPSGRYRISSWLAFSQALKEKKSRKELPREASLEFTVSPGRVRYLGKFSGFTSYDVGHNTILWIRPAPIAKRDLMHFMELAYPHFPFELVDPRPSSVYGN
jgi:hypothetical protein